MTAVISAIIGSLMPAIYNQPPQLNYLSHSYGESKNCNPDYDCSAVH